MDDLPTHTMPLENINDAFELVAHWSIENSPLESRERRYCEGNIQAIDTVIDRGSYLVSNGVW